jgi:hypothetical protein
MRIFIKFEFEKQCTPVSSFAAYQIGSVKYWCWSLVAIVWQRAELSMWNFKDSVILRSTLPGSSSTRWVDTGFQREGGHGAVLGPRFIANLLIGARRHRFGIGRKRGFSNHSRQFYCHLYCYLYYQFYYQIYYYLSCYYLSYQLSRTILLLIFHSIARRV